MAKLPVQTRGLISKDQDISDSLSAVSEATLIPQYMTATTVTGSPAAGTFHSKISGRAPMLDLSKIPSGKQGVERIQEVAVELKDGEIGPDGENVYEILNDPRFRLYGDPTIFDNSLGKHFENNAILEVTFYGTGLNILYCLSDASDRGGEVFVDGISIGSFSHTGTDIIDQRNYPSRKVINLVSGLSQGVHTVRFESAGSIVLFYAGFEILNESTDVAIPEGSVVADGARYNLVAGTDDLTTFENEYQDGSGTITDVTKGGHTVRYIDTDGTVKKDINYVDSTQLNLAAADHSNEEVVQKFNWKEFGAGRSDDFSTLDNLSGQNRVFTLDDGTTTLVGILIGEGDGNIGNNRLFIGVGGTLTLTFVGTGLDIVWGNEVSAGTRDIDDVIVDGTSIGPITVGTPAASFEQKLTVVSGLPFGTHTVRFVNSIADNSLGFEDFVIYGPKKPTIPIGAVEIDSTYKMADFTANTTANPLYLSEGILRKDATREMVYSGSWQPVQSSTGFVGFLRLWSSTPGVYFSYSFFGTGWCWRGEGGGSQSDNVLVEVDDGSGFQTLNTANYPSIVATTSGGMSFNTATGEMDTSSGGTSSEITVSGMPLDQYTIRFTEQGAGSDDLSVDAFDIITPTYNYHNNILNTDDSMVGSNTLKNELLIPGATKNKIIATEGVDLGKSKTRWQRRYLQTTITTSVTDINDLRLTNLTIGRTYRLTLHGAIGVTAPDNTFKVALLIANYGKISGQSLWVGSVTQNGTGDKGCGFQGSGNVIFVANQATITFSFSTNGAPANMLLQGTGDETANNTWVQLEEIDNFEETNIWGG